MVRKKSTTQIPPKTPRTISNDTRTFKALWHYWDHAKQSIWYYKWNRESAARYAQSVSNFQAEYLEATKMVIQTFTNFQSALIKFSWINYDNRSTLYTDQTKNQITMLTENIIKTFDIWNQITIDSIDIAKENIKIYTEAMTSTDIHNRDLISSWNSFPIPTYCK